VQNEEQRRRPAGPAGAEGQADMIAARRRILVLLALVVALVVPPVGTLAAAPTQAWTGTTTLVGIRTAHHPGYDRMVFDFSGPLPAYRSVTWTKALYYDGSGKPAVVQGNAHLRVVLRYAVGHDAAGRSTYGPATRGIALPGYVQLRNLGDFEGVLTFGIGVSRRTYAHVYTLTHPSRLVIDLSTPYRTTSVRSYVQNSVNYRTGHTPYTTPVWRPVIPPAVATGALQRLFAGPTAAEQARGLRLVASGATGFSYLSISGGVARVRLTGTCSSGGSTYTIADQIMPTLKQFRSVHWVKIYDSKGRTERPYGRSDSIPECLEP
jgi:hypothetical protein